MRDSLQESIKTQHIENVQYPKGSVVLCCACLKPLYMLQRSIFAGEKTSRTVDAYRPLTVKDIDDLEKRVDEPGVAAMVRLWTPEDRKLHAESIPEVRTGSLALCPSCDRSWVYSRAVEAAEVHDRAYVWELVVLFPKESVEKKVARAWPTTDTIVQQ